MGSRIHRDYHGFLLQEAMKDAEDIIYDVRARNLRLKKHVHEDVEIITGNGVIKEHLIALFERYGLKPSVKLGNSGVILCTIE